ncbi:MAG TPA: hypothetical protein VHP35_05965 [Terriglobia bacterium]|jgi:hypothetical protein|nr:hypothetical protein [Terriglobia bacterium]
MENYFNYFTEIEEHFQKRRESLQLLSPLDWALIESFQEAGVPLEVVLRGIDLAFERHAKRKSKAQKVNSLSYCTQAILREFERLQENSVGKGRRAEVETKREQNDRESLAEMIDRSAGQLNHAHDRVRSDGLSLPPDLFEHIASSLALMKQEVLGSDSVDYEQLELRLCLLEEKILGALVAALSEEKLLALRTQVNQELNRHRRGLKAEQLAMLEKKMINRKLLERFGVPRLSLFYMPLN